VATDYDERRDKDAIEAEEAESLDALREKTATQVDVLMVDDSNLLEDLELPGADLSGESLTVTVVPRQRDEFRCERCFLVLHESLRVQPGTDVCRDCA